VDLVEVVLHFMDLVLEVLALLDREIMAEMVKIGLHM
jgi:hypothetical protein